MKIGFIGAGRVGCTLGKYLKERGKGFLLTGYHSRSRASAIAAADFTGSRVYGSSGELLADCDAVFITTGDNAIATVWEELCNCRVPLENRLVIHCSGALASDIYADAELMGATRVSLHPLYAVSDRFESWRTIGTALFTIEGSGARFEELYGLLAESGLTLQRLDADKKVKYHAAAAVASNLMVGLSELAIGLLTDCGFDRTQARIALRPLMQGNLDAVMETDTAEALTGPAERADAATVERHLGALDGEDREIYRLLTKKLIHIAKKKHPQRDYAGMENLLR